MAKRKELLAAGFESSPAVKAQAQEIIMEPGEKAPLHRHPCPAIGVVMEGEIDFQLQAEPVSRLRPGDVFYEPAGVKVAKFDNAGNAPAKFYVFYLLGKNEERTIQLLE